MEGKLNVLLYQVVGDRGCIALGNKPHDMSHSVQQTVLPVLWCSVGKLKGLKVGDNIYKDIHLTYKVKKYPACEVYASFL